MITFEVAPGVSQWGYDETVYAGGQQHEVEADDADFAAALVGAHRAGAINIVSGVTQLPSDSVESDKESLKFREKVEDLRAKQKDRPRRAQDIAREVAQMVEDRELEAPYAAALHVQRMAELDAPLADQIEELRGA